MTSLIHAAIACSVCQLVYASCSCWHDPSNTDRKVTERAGLCQECFTRQKPTPNRLPETTYRLTAATTPARRLYVPLPPTTRLCVQCGASFSCGQGAKRLTCSEECRAQRYLLYGERPSVLD